MVQFKIILVAVFLFFSSFGFSEEVLDLDIKLLDKEFIESCGGGTYFQRISMKTITNVPLKTYATDYNLSSLHSEKCISLIKYLETLYETFENKIATKEGMKELNLMNNDEAEKFIKFFQIFSESMRSKLVLFTTGFNPEEQK
jgi:hypothetical protein